MPGHPPTQNRWRHAAGESVAVKVGSEHSRTHHQALMAKAMNEAILNITPITQRTALNATAVDKRIKAVVAATMSDMTRVMSKGYNDSVTLEQRTKFLEQLGQQRWKDAEDGSAAYQPAYNRLKCGEAQFMVDYHDYYMTPRGYHPRAVNSGNSWMQITPLSFMNMPILTYIKEISPRPLLLIHGENAHSRNFSETAYAAAAQPKALLIVKGANHIDLYDDKAGKIPFDKMADSFGKNLK